MKDYNDYLEQWAREAPARQAKINEMHDMLIERVLDTMSYAEALERLNRIQAAQVDEEETISGGQFNYGADRK